MLLKPHWAACVATLLLCHNILRAQNTLFSDDFETDQTWTIFEEIVSGNPCYGDGIGEVARSTDIALNSANSLSVWSNKNTALKSNHVIAAHHISNSEGLTGALRYSTWVYCSTTPGLTQTGPELSVQSTRNVGGINTTFIAGLQYVGNQWVTNKWNIWHNGTWQALTPAEFNVTLVANTWYYVELTFSMTTNKYHALTIKGGSIDATLDLTATFLNAPSGFEIGGETRGWTPSCFVTLESENLWSDCAQAYQNIVYYDDIKLEKNEANLSVKGLYVDDFSTILGNTAKENAVLSYALSKGFNYLALYELHYFDFTNAVLRNQLADFIRRAKTLYGITQVGATGEIASFFSDRIIGQYQASRTDPLEKFDVLDLEFEFWSPVFTNPDGYYCTTYLQTAGLPCDRSGAFTFYMQQLAALQQLCAANNLICEAEFGWFTQAEANQFVPLCDRILVHAYVPTAWIDSDPATFYQYTKERLQYIAQAALIPPAVMVIFSSEEAFSGPWLRATTPPRMPSDAYDLYKTHFDAEASGWVFNLRQVGMQWFTYTLMPENGAVLPVEMIGFHGVPQSNGNYLTWETGSLQETESIVVEQSSNAVNFASIATLSPEHHAFLDQFFLPITYYRLKFIAWGGSINYSSIIPIQRNNPLFHIYPNPATDIIIVDQLNEEDRVQIFDGIGHKVMDLYPGTQGKIIVSSLPKGIYVLKAERQIAKFIKLHSFE